MCGNYGAMYATHLEINSPPPPMGLIQVTELLRSRVGKAIDIDYRVVPTVTAQSDFINPPLTPIATTVDFAVGATALNSSAFASVGGVLQV